MIAKTFEIRDAATFIPVLAVKMEPGNEQDRYLLSRAGYGITPECQAESVLLSSLDGGASVSDPYDWGNRTRIQAHKYIKENFDKLESGSVVDVEFILGIAQAPKQSESKDVPL